MAQSLKGYLDLRHITGLSGADLETNSVSAKGFAAGQPIWMMDAFGLKMFTLVQNRGAATMPRGQLVSRVGNVNGVTIVTNSVGTTTSITFATAGLTANALVGGIAYLSSTGSTAIATAEGESSIVVSNSSNAVNMDTRYPFSGTPGAGLIAHIMGTYNVEVAATLDLGTTVAGSIVGQDGITTGNFGFAQSFGPNARVLKDTATSNSVFLVTQMAMQGTGSGVCISATAGTNLNLVIGRAMAPASSVAADALLSLACGQGFQTVGTGQVS